ncbi:MAG: hypothetical protein AAF919_17230 [Pseudomonadota bacterium]
MIDPQDPIETGNLPLSAEERTLLSVLPCKAVVSASFQEGVIRRTLQTKVSLNQDLRAFLRRDHIAECPHLDPAFKFAGKNGLHAHLPRGLSEDWARTYVGNAVRVLQFMDATGLRPSKVSVYRRRSYANSPEPLPGADHTSMWQDPTSRVRMMLDEPYTYREIDIAGRARWADAHGFSIVPLQRGGVYNLEGGTKAFIVLKKRDEHLAHSVNRRIARLPVCFKDLDQTLITNRR